MAGFRLKLYRMAKVHRGEERRTIGFALIYLMISMITGLLGSGADILFLRHQTTAAEMNIITKLKNLQAAISGTEPELLGGAGNINSLLGPPLLGFGALLLIAVGIGYTGWTDRRSKRYVFLGGMAAAFLVALATAFVFLFPELEASLPYFYSFLYILRFSGGVFLLMVFWDITGHYFDIRQGKRLYPLLAMSGVIGYTLGTLLVSPVLHYTDPAVLFLLTAALSAGSYLLFLWMHRYVRPLWNSRKRSEGFRETLQEGFNFFLQNRFLRVLTLSTLLFGVAGGLIMFTFNSVVTEYAGTSRGTINFISFQRAIASILQAVIVTKVLSQSAVGGKMRSNFIVQVLVLFLGFLAFVISMVGVADFTRQIAIALMSPAAMASFGIIPAEYRGRSMSAVNLIIAPAGMVLASLAVIVLEGFFALKLFISLIAFFLLARLAMNIFVNRAYVKTLTSGAGYADAFDAASLFEEAESLLQDDGALSVWMKKLEDQEESVKLLIWSRLLEKVQSRSEFDRLKPYAPPLRGRRGALWLGTLSLYEPDTAREEIENFIRVGASGEEVEPIDENGDGEIRGEALRIIRSSLEPSDPLRQWHRNRRSEILEKLNAGDSSFADDPALTEPLIIECEEEDPETAAALRRWWELQARELQGWPLNRGEEESFIINLMLKYPREELQPFYFSLLKDSELRPDALTSLEHMDSLDMAKWEEAYHDRDSESEGLALQDLLQRHLGPERMRWFWSFFEQEVSSIANREENLYRDMMDEEHFLLLEGLYRSAMTVQEDMPARIKPCNREIIARMIRYKGEILSLENLPFPENYPYEALYRRWLHRFDELLLRLLLSALAFRFRDFEQRHRYFLLVQDLQPGLPSVRSKVLELLEIELPKSEQQAVSLFLEDLTLEEKLLRLGSVLESPQASWQGFFDYWGRYAEITGDSWRARLLRSAV